MATKPKAGLEDVVAGESSICYLDGSAGVLAYHGYDIHDLADAERGVSFEEVCYLLWHGRLPSRSELGDLRTQLASARVLPDGVMRVMRSIPPVDGMDALRTLTSVLAHGDPDADDRSPAASYRKAVRLTGQIGSIVATWGRMAAGGGAIDPDPALGHAANFLYMLTGTRPSPLAARAFDVSLILHADHELNASTFAARVAAATLTDIHSTIVAAIGTLKGPLHGGANAEVMKMLIEIGRDGGPDRAEAFVRAKLGRKEKVSGFGHRVYRTEDPRATHLRRLSKRLGEQAGQPQWFEMSQRIEAVILADKKLYANVDFYSASMFYSMGIPIDLYTPIFAVSRVSGWTAHVLEQYANNRLIRPRTDYIGPSYPQQVLPLDAR
ncbi:MAG TPA: citrate synthase [Vicinamibacterales bacterium]|nr:citrate synthase [Vicinamibacterales bacterium]